MKYGKWVAAAIAVILVVAAFFAVGMTWGNTQNGVPKIKQFTLQRDTQSDQTGTLKLLSQNVRLTPSSYESLSIDEQNYTYNGETLSCALWDSVAKAVDHIVIASNEGDGDGYVRTWFAFEQGTLTAEEFDRIIRMNRNETAWTWTAVEYGVEIEGTVYAVFCAEYVANGGVLAAGETAEASLLQLFIEPSASSMQIDAIDDDGNGFYKILVKTQCVSDSAAWSAAFGTQHPW